MSTIAIKIDYTNHRGERAIREIVPKTIYFGANEWHPHEQWLMTAYDMERQAERTFAMRDVHRWGV